ncbi:MAG: aldehyde dehydrogenase family protein, partial [Chitinivibrionales bacterium]|nr:aldehyde dehydrogenase family protein [Chitinivibrionales bacterium]
MATTGQEILSQDVSAIVAEVVKRLKPHLQSAMNTRPAVPEKASLSQASPVHYGSGSDGVFATVDAAVLAAAAAQKKLCALGLDKRGEICSVIRRICVERAEELGRMEYDESRIGRADHKVEKLKLVPRVVGVEIFKTASRIDQTGLHLIEAAPFGVIGMVTPATHSVPTMAGNAINVIAAGNTAVFSPHPAAARSLRYALQLFNRGIQKTCGLANLLTIMEKPTIETANQLFNHPQVALICVTGGPAVVKAAMKSGKRVIAAGPGNPPAVVDEGVNLDKAARDIMAGASFDNNLLCIGEKEVFVVESVFDRMMAAMERAGAVRLTASQIAA